MTCTDRYDPGSYQQRKWENALTIDKTSWGYNRNASYWDYMTVRELIHELIQVVAFNGNMLLNIGPAADGTLHPIFVDRLMGMGKWLQFNGEAIYKSKPWRVCQQEKASSVYYTRKKNCLYAHFTKWPRGSQLKLECPIPTAKTQVRMLGMSNATVHYNASLEWSRLQGSMAGMAVKLPRLTPNLIPCQHAWVLVLTNLGNL